MNRKSGVVITSSLCPNESMVSSVKIVKFLSEKFKLPTTCWKKHGDLMDVDYAFIVNASTTFMDDAYRDFLNAQMKRVRKAVIYCQNDYKLLPHSTWVKKPLIKNGVPIIYWTIIRRRIKNELDRYVDWNQLAYEPVSTFPKHHYDSRQKRLFYYGSYRKDREPLFLKYFSDECKIRRCITAPTPRTAKRFTALLSSTTSAQVQARKDNAISQLRWEQLVLYIQDPYSSRNTEALANRFYECLSARTALAIDEASLGTFRAAGMINAERYVVDGAADPRLKKLLSNSKDIAHEQWLAWRTPYLMLLENTVEDNFNELVRKIK